MRAIISSPSGKLYLIKRTRQDIQTAVAFNSQQ